MWLETADFKNSKKRGINMTEIKDGFIRVTSVFSPFVKFDHIDPLVLHNACERGTKVHRLAELHMLNEYFPDPDESLLGYLNSFRAWYDSMVSELISTEQRLYDTLLKVTGAVDIIAILKNDKAPTIIDIKTPATESKSWCLQTAMYRQLFQHSERHES